MKKDSKIALSISGGLLVLIAVLIFTLEEEKAEIKAQVSPAVSIEKTWKLPRALEEISGMAFVEQGKIAAVQDEKGIIYIYDLETSKIEQEIPFSGAGDYEGMAVKDENAFVVESAGRIHVLHDFRTGPEVESFQTFLENENDVEGLALNAAGDQLLLALKGDDPNSEDYKGIYAFDLQSKQLERAPAYKLDFQDDILVGLKSKMEEKVGDVFFPSEIAVHPKNGKIYILEAEKPRILILDPEGLPLEVHRLDPLHFPQPEGMNFDPSGNLFISNEGTPATLHQIEIK